MNRSRRLRPAWLAIVLVSLASMIGVTPAYAITGGEPDNGAHPQVGLIYDYQNGYICSGTLIAPTVVLTAAHCTSGYTARGATEIWVSFDEHVTDESTFYSSVEWYSHPEYVDESWPYTVDVGVVILTEAVDLPLAGLADAWTLETIIPERGASHQVFTDVGYGVSGVEVGGGPPRASLPLERRQSWQNYHPGQNEMVGSIHGYDELLLQLKANPSSRHGSGCGGDSGGPIFLGDSWTIVAIHTGGYRLGYDGQLCGRISSLNHRIDTEVVLNWLDGFI